MFNITRKSVQFGQETLTVETGRLARQADGAVLVSYGETMVLVTAVADKSPPREGQDFFPLGVHYQEKQWAAGRIPGGFIKRETRPSEKETLTSRLIDRPLRPLFPKSFLQDTQVIASVVSFDGINNSDIPGMVGASAALAISGLPFQGPIAGARVGMIDGEYVLNPTVEQMEQSDLDLVVAGTDSAVMMVESEANILSEEQMLDAVMFGFEGFQPVISMIKELAAEVGKAPQFADEEEQTVDPDLMKLLSERYEEGIKKGYAIPEKMARQDALRELRKEAAISIPEDVTLEYSSGDVKSAFKKLESGIMRGMVLSTGKRIDGRSTSDVRPIETEVGIFPRVHGSSLFTRGETQAMVVITLGTGRDEQIVEDMNGERRDNFYLNYAFPPFSVGETGRVGAPKRREIGHGKLATRALAAVIPDREAFCYTMRVVSEVTESNGSSSMATVCGSSMALMDAGVPIKSPVAGIAMGLIKEDDRFAVLTDILGDEDHLGDMDFKVAGTTEGITALQMDIKIGGINREIMSVALEQAKAGRMHILDRMGATIGASRDDLSNHAPRIKTIKIHPDKIRDIIGPGGKVIRGITEQTGCQIDVEDDGTVRVASSDGESAKQAEDIIKQIVADVEKGQTYEGTVVRITDFGAFVNILPKKDGLVHISQLANRRVQKVTDVVKEGDVVKVKVLDIDRQGRVKLTMKDA